MVYILKHKITIRNLLLFRKNEPFNSLLVKESERLIRAKNMSMRFIFTLWLRGKSDSVDIFIRELDKWSIIPAGSISASRIRINLTDKNFVGFGHEFRNAFSRNFIFRN